MNELELILYDVGHGLAMSIIEYPENYVTQIDLGASDDFSPLSWLNNSRGLRPDVLYITHPHADHLHDVEQALYGKFCPDYINYQQYDWDDVIEREIPNRRGLIEHYIKLTQKVPYGSYAGSASLQVWYYSPEKARSIFGESAYINNSSQFILYKWKDFKISICGDLETQAMERIANQKNIIEAAQSTDILIAPHHGHNQGFTPEWAENMGRPHITLVSVQSRDPHVASGYSSGDFARGVDFHGENRYRLTTRKDGTIFVKMYYSNNNEPSWTFNAAKYD